jgi:hypothetical protein
LYKKTWSMAMATTTREEPCFIIHRTQGFSRESYLPHATRSGPDDTQAQQDARIQHVVQTLQLAHSYDFRNDLMRWHRNQNRYHRAI